MPHKQGKWQFPLFASKSSNFVRATSTVNVGMRFGVTDGIGVKVGGGTNVIVGVKVGVVVGISTGGVDMHPTKASNTKTTIHLSQ
jgi:hypothetical protein